MDAGCKVSGDSSRKVQDGIDRIFDLLVSKLRIHGKAEDFFGKLFRRWEGALSRITELLVGLGQMQGDGIVNPCSNSIGTEVVAQRVALLRPNHKQMEYVFAASRYFWCYDGRICKR